jgi:hypothetical protein
MTRRRRSAAQLELGFFPTLPVRPQARERRLREAPMPTTPATPDEARHVAHCCANHGCAYDSDDCPVEAARIRQRSPCGAAAPCDRVRPVRLPPRAPNLSKPAASGLDLRTQHLTGGAQRGGKR